MARELYDHERQLIEGLTAEEARALIAIVNGINRICGLPKFGEGDHLN